MKLPKKISIEVLSNTVFMQSNEFNFSYTPADDVVKEEHKGKYRYFGGLQHCFDDESKEANQLESELCEIAELILGKLNRINQAG